MTWWIVGTRESGVQLAFIYHRTLQDHCQTLLACFTQKDAHVVLHTAYTSAGKECNFQCNEGKNDYLPLQWRFIWNFLLQYDQYATI